MLCGESKFESGLEIGYMTAETDSNQGSSRAGFQGQDVNGSRSVSFGLDL